MSNNNNSKSSFLIGLACGLGAGIIAGVLAAPKSGRELRHDIQVGSAEWAASLTERINELKDKAADKFSDIRDFADEKFRKSALNIQNRAADLGKQLDELTSKTKKEKQVQAV